MARPIRSLKTDSAGLAVTSITPDPPAHQAGDMLLIVATKYLDGDTLSASGWATIEQVAAASGVRASCAAFWIEAASSSETMPTITSVGAANEMMAVVYVIRGHNATPIDTSASGSQASAADSFTFAALTTNYPNSLVLNFAIPEDDAKIFQFLAPTSQFSADTDGDRCAISCGWFTQVTAGTSSQSKCFTAVTTAQYSWISIAIRDDGSSAEPCVDPDTTAVELVHPMMIQASGSYLSSGVADPTSYFSTDTVDGQTPVYRAMTTANSLGDGSAYITNSISIDVTSSGDTGNLYVCEVGLVTPVSLSGYLISAIIGSDFNPTNGAYYADGGHYFGITDGTNISLWKVDALDTLPSIKLGTYNIIIDPSETPYYSRGTVNLSAVSGFIVGQISQTGTHNFSVGAIHRISKTTPIPIIGGSAARPANFSTLESVSKTNGLGIIANQRGFTDGQVFCAAPIQIGNGDDATYFDAGNQSLAFCKAYDENNLFVAHNVPAEAVGLAIKASSSDTIRMSPCTVDCVNTHKFTVDPASNPSATYALDGLSVLNAEPTLEGVGAAKYAGVNFSGGNELNLSSFTTGDSLGAGDIANCREDYAVTVSTEDEFNALRNRDFKGNNFSIRITGNHGGETWTGTGMTVSGGTGSHDIEYTGTGALTLGMDSGSGWSTLRCIATGGGSIEVVQPELQLTLTNMQVGSDVVILAAGTDTVLASFDQITGTTFSYTYTGTPLLDIGVIKPGFVPLYLYGYQTGSTSASLPMKQTADRSYAA